jgi:hypothetical protein
MKWKSVDDDTHTEEDTVQNREKEKRKSSPKKNES